MAFPLAAVMQLIGGLTQAYAGLEAGKAEAESLEYDAYIAQQDAQLIEEAGEFELGKARTERRRLLSRQVAMAAASGRDISGGSPLAFIEAQERAALMDEQVISFNKNIAVGGKLSEAALLFGASSTVRNATRAGFYTSLLGVGAKAYKKFTTKVETDDVKTPIKKKKYNDGSYRPEAVPRGGGGASRR